MLSAPFLAAYSNLTIGERLDDILILLFGAILPFPPWLVPIRRLAVGADCRSHMDIPGPPFMAASKAPVAWDANLPAILYYILFVCVFQMVYVYLITIY